MSDGERSHGLAEKVLDVVLYAPVGALDMLRTDAPRLAADGRRRLEQRVRTARWIGEMAVTVGRQKVAARWAERTSRPAAGTSQTADSATSGAAQQGHAASGTAPHPESALAAATEASSVPSEPFHGYDALPASELVTLLHRLTRGELELVRHYESATRARRTVIAKVDQLLGAV